MKTYTKRIAFIVSCNHNIPTSGIGQFSKCFVEMATEFGWKVDIIMDKMSSSREDFAEVLERKGANIVALPDPLKRTGHSNFYSFGDNYCIEDIANGRDSIVRALQSNFYDLAIINSQELILSWHTLALPIPVIAYSHESNAVFLQQAKNSTHVQEYFDMAMAMFRCPGVITGTQTERNKIELDAAGFDARALAMPLPEQGLLTDSSDREKSGVLFIGRWEDRKGPMDFINMIKETKLPAKVMTTKTSAKKFVKFLDEIGVEHDVRYAIVEEEKVDFIKGCKVFYMPSKKESYGFALMECLGHMPCVVHEDREWIHNFDLSHVSAVAEDDVAAEVTFLYHDPSIDRTAALAYVSKINQAAKDSWANLFDEDVFRLGTNGTSAISKADEFYLSDYIKDTGRVFNRDDILALRRCIGKFNITYTDDDTYLSSTTSVPPGREHDGQEHTGDPMDNLFG